MKLIVAYDQKRGIAKEGKIPWNIPEDLRFFKAVTLGETVIMGRNTWESLPKKPLPDRKNIVFTRNFIPDVGCIDSLDKLPKQYTVIGGSQMYNLFLKNNLIKYVIATEIKEDYHCDLFFPELNWKSQMIFSNERYDVKIYTV